MIFGLYISDSGINGNLRAINAIPSLELTNVNYAVLSGLKLTA